MKQATLRQLYFKFIAQSLFFDYYEKFWIEMFYASFVSTIDQDLKKSEHNAEFSLSVLVLFNRETNRFPVPDPSRSCRELVSFSKPKAV